MTKEVALIGEQLIHTYPYIVHFNGSDRDRIEKNAKAWMQRFMLDHDLSAKSGEVRVTRIWSPDAEEVGRLAETFGIEKVCASAEEAVNGADGVLVMDEIIESRTALIEKCLRAGLTVFADKVLSTDASRTAELLALADEKKARARSWSQLYFLPDLRKVREAPPGGVGFLNYQLGLDILPAYGIHPISMLQGAFDSHMKNYRPLSDADTRSGLLEFENDTRIFLYVGTDIPFRGRLYYCAGDQEIIANQADDWACFENAATALIDLFAGRSMVSGPGLGEMNQATRLIEVMLRGGSDGKAIPLGE